MRLVSFDVGIKNLAYCVFAFPEKSQWSIPEWTCVNLLANDLPPKPCCHLIKGKTKTAADHLCGKKSKWIAPDNDAVSYCELHAKMHNEWIIPKKQHTTSHINKLKLAELEQEYFAVFGKEEEPSTPFRIEDEKSAAHSSLITARKAGVLNEKMCKKRKKSELIERIMKYYELKCFQSATETKTKNAGEIDLVTIGRAIRRQLDGDASIEGTTHVIIENQISTIAARMKTIQGMIAQYFIMRFGDEVRIEFVSSHNKLKGFSEATASLMDVATQKATASLMDVATQKVTATKETASLMDVATKEPTQPKTTYKANKSDGITICRLFFESNSEEMGKWSPFFEKSSKRDDLADCFLQGIWYLKSNKIIYYAARLKHKYCVCIINNGDN